MLSFDNQPSVRGPGVLNDFVILAVQVVPSKVTLVVLCFLEFKAFL